MNERDAEFLDLLKTDCSWVDLYFKCRSLDLETLEVLPKLTLCVSSRFSSKPDFVLMETLFMELLWGKKMTEEDLKRITPQEDEATFESFKRRMKPVIALLESHLSEFSQDNQPVYLACLNAFLV